MAKFKDYFFIGGGDPEKLEKLHNLVVECKGNLFTNNGIQDLLLNDGYILDGERPTSFNDVYNSVFLRTRTSIHLGILEKIIETATNPQLTIIKREKEGIVSPKGKGIVYPNDTTIKIDFETPDGYSSNMVEKFQKRWFKEPEVVESIRNFQDSLTKAFKEFNLQFILGRMHKSLNIFIPEDFGKTYNMQNKIKNTFGKYENHGKKLNALDNAYYNTGKRFFNQAGKYHTELGKSDFGKMFILSPEEDQKAMEEIMRRRAC